MKALLRLGSYLHHPDLMKKTILDLHVVNACLKVLNADFCAEFSRILEVAFPPDFNALGIQQPQYRRISTIGAQLYRLPCLGGASR